MTRAVAVGLLALLVTAGGAREAAAGHESVSVLLPASPLEGSRLFASKGCLECHSVQGAGGTAGPDLGRGVLNRPLLEIAAIMWNHSPGMERVFQERRVARPTFKPSEMASLLAFLYYLGSLDPPGDAERGALLFRDRTCVTCHAVDGTGGKGGPDLARYSGYVSPLFLTTSLWNHGAAMARAMAARKVERPTFRGNDIPDLLAYIRSAGGGVERVYAAPGSPKHGEALFTQKHCIECHSVRGHGGRMGPDLGVEVKGSFMRIAGAMWNHGPRMWARMQERGLGVPSLTTDEMSDLVSYLYFFQFIDPPGDARRGLLVYRDKRCGSCHEATGPKRVAPQFAEVVDDLKTPLGVITAMWNHAGRMTELMVEQNVAWPALKGSEMADLIAYLLGTQPLPAGRPVAGGPPPPPRAKAAAPAK